MPPSRARSDAWLTPLRAEFEAARFRHWVFLGTSEPVITLVTRTDLEQPSDYLRVAGVRQGRFDLAFGPELTALLTHPLRERHAERLRPAPERARRLTRRAGSHPAVFSPLE